MGRPRLHPIRIALTALMLAGAVSIASAAPARATSWQKAWGDYDSQEQWHDASWWLQHRHDWVEVNHPEWTENYADTFGQIGDYDRYHVWRYGDGGFDRSSARSNSDGLSNESLRARVYQSLSRESAINEYKL